MSEQDFENERAVISKRDSKRFVIMFESKSAMSFSQW
jgi:hypothetical protein